MADEKVGIRELRQNLSVYVDRVRKGERFTVTDHNEPVAELGPVVLDPKERRWRELVVKLGMIEPTRSRDELPPPVPYPPGYTGPTVSEDIQRERDSYYEDP